MNEHAFDAVIEEGRGGGAWVRIPINVPEVFGTKGRVKVKASFDGEPYRGSIAPMGGSHILGVAKAIRAKIGKTIGDTVHVISKQDTEPRVVQVPEELKAALDANPEAGAQFEGMSYTHRKEYAGWISSAKREETRERRLQQAIEKLSRGEKP